MLDPTKKRKLSQETAQMKKRYKNVFKDTDMQKAYTSFFEVTGFVLCVYKVQGDCMPPFPLDSLVFSFAVL